MVVHIDPILAGIPYAGENGLTVWLMPPLREDVTDEQRDYRRQCLALLNLRGHWVVEGTEHDLALAVNEAHQ